LYKYQSWKPARKARQGWIFPKREARGSSAFSHLPAAYLGKGLLLVQYSLFVGSSQHNPLVSAFLGPTLEITKERQRS
jgi:hypothetical protein